MPLKLGIYSDIFSDPGFADFLIEGDALGFEEILFLNSGNLIKNRSEILSVKNFLFLNLYINGIGMQFAEFLVGEGKQIFAIPGNLDSYSARGCNFLLQTGTAVMVTCAQDLEVIEF